MPTNWTPPSIYNSEELTLLRQTISRFVEQEVAPNGEQWEEDGMVPRDVLQRMGALGLFGMRYGEQYGGSELDTLSSLILSEEVGRSTFGGFSATVLVHTDMASPHIERFGSTQQKAKYLPGICSGEIITAIGVTEPGAGSDVAGMTTRAVREGEEYVLNGAKVFITNGVHGDLFCIAAKTDTDVKPSRGISMFLIEKGTPGFSVARKLDKHGWRSSDTAELVFEDCRVPAENLLGEENKGFYAIMANFPERTPGDRRHGHRRGHQGHRYNAGIPETAPRLSAHHYGTIRRSVSVWRCGRRRSRACGNWPITSPGWMRRGTIACVRSRC